METIPAKTIVTRTKSPGSWFGVDYNMNLYRGCCHGCIYCDSRSDCYGIEHFDRVRVKENCLQIVRDELRRKVLRGVVGTGSMSDPYNPLEREYRYTRHALELLSAFGFGAAIATKSDLITRDMYVLREIRQQMPVLCKLTVTTAGDALAAKIEPYAPLPSARFKAIERLSAAGLFSGVLLMPVLPFLEDNVSGVCEIVRQAADAGAKFIYPSFGVTCRDRQREYYYRQLDAEFPGLRAKYVRQYGTGYYCASPRTKELWAAFTEACVQRGILFDMKTIIRAYKSGYDEPQISLF
ncbi:MAG: radical SAM protein [Intestinibacillus sp.]